MFGLPDYLTSGERARLFPVLADTSKEGRSTSILLSCLSNVREFGQAMLSSIGQRTGVRSTITAFTEVVFKGAKDTKNHRPDGLIILTTGKRDWRALVEAKIGSNELTEDQLTSYIELARAHAVDAVITVSNEFTSAPEHHPVLVSARVRGKVALYHWSWMFVLTQADLLVSKGEIEDSDQHFILNEMIRFLAHPSAGVKGFDSMPASWTEIVQKVSAGASLSARSEDVSEVVAAWHQEVRDLSLILSRQIGVPVQVRLSRAHAADPIARTKNDAAQLADMHSLSATLVVPDAAAPIDVAVDVGRRTISASMQLRAPSDRKSTKARLNWLLRQLQKASDENVYLRLHWPGRGAPTQYTLAELRVDSEVAESDNRDKQPHSFEVCMIRQTAGRFGQRKNFIADLEDLVPAFYEAIGQHVRAYQTPAPRVREDRTDPESVAAEGIRAAAEDEARNLDDRSDQI